MKRRVTEEKPVGIPREAERTCVTAVDKKNEVREEATHPWRQRHAELESSEVKKMRTSEAENAPLKKPLGERDLETDAMLEVVRRKW